MHCSHSAVDELSLCYMINAVKTDYIHLTLTLLTFFSIALIKTCPSREKHQILHTSRAIQLVFLIQPMHHENYSGGLDQNLIS